ncbi:hypothetical protein TNCT_446231 [Trichonephila clavata]|uniref:Secreted protein n=1 Tax=Trichonephila clavata TaxID=2740835 RepID=A0A8X6G6C6_TRICU|nr:hypothetical protein TNCT_446231 [Trichonephila clavata]
MYLMRGCETPGLIMFIGLLLETAADEVSITDAGVHDYLIISSSLGGRYQICRYWDQRCCILKVHRTLYSVLYRVNLIHLEEK